MTVVSLSPPPSLLPQCMISIFICPSSSSLFLPLPSLLPSLFQGQQLQRTLFGFLDLCSSKPLCFSLSTNAFLCPLPSLRQPSSASVSGSLCSFHVWPHLWCICASVCVCVWVFSVLVQQRRRGKQRGSPLSVCTLSSLSQLSSLSSLNVTRPSTRPAFVSHTSSVSFLYHF